MTAAASYAAILAAYLERFPEEVLALAPLLDRLAAADDIHDRRAMTGHVTASGFVMDGDGALLLVLNRALGRWLQPGGHVEAGERAWQAAPREVHEETGALGARIVPWCADPRVPLDVDIHAIPANPRKGEGGHLHFDFRYRIAVDRVPEDRLADAEIGGVRWERSPPLVRRLLGARTLRKLGEIVRPTPAR